VVGNVRQIGIAVDYCCEAMWKQFEVDSDDERLIFFQKEFGEYGLLDRKDLRAYTPIAFCPWCGKDILSARFKALEANNPNVSPHSADENRA
jgi:hypothetical protein